VLALRIARAATGKDKFIKFEGHYHGWHDALFVGLRPPYERPLSAGVPRSARGDCLVLPPNHTAAVEEALAERDDIGCVIVEAAGGSHGTVPTSPAWIAELRRLTREHQIPLVFDEMVSGFRRAPGGYQGWSGITPDLTVLGKALFGGFPGGAVAGSAELMELTCMGADPFAAHYGTFNAFPVSCAAGVATLRRLSDGSVHDQINERGKTIRAALNQVIAEKGVHARVYGTGSHIHFLLRAWPFEGDSEVPPPGRHGELAADPNQQRLFRLAMLVSGIDVAFGNNVSAVHGEAEAEALSGGFAAALELLIEDGLIATL
jgi:glutamate-1-semialdehyde 2,1-aminomutase